MPSDDFVLYVNIMKLTTQYFVLKLRPFCAALAPFVRVADRKNTRGIRALPKHVCIDFGNHGAMAIRRREWKPKEVLAKEAAEVSRVCFQVHMAQLTERPLMMVFNFLSDTDYLPVMQTSAEWLSALDLECEIRLAIDFQRDDVRDVFQGRPKLAKARPSRRFVELHRMIRASLTRFDQLLYESGTASSTSTQSLFLLEKKLQLFVYNNLCGAPAWPFGCNDPLSLEPEPGKPKIYFQDLASEEQRTPWNVAEIGDIFISAPCFEAVQLVNLLLRLGWLEDRSRGTGKTIMLEADKNMFIFKLAMPSVYNQPEAKRVLEDNLMIGKLYISDIDEAHLSGFMGLEFAHYGGGSRTQAFVAPMEDEVRVVPWYHIIANVAAFPCRPLFTQHLQNQRDHLADNVPEELVRFIWMNFGSMHVDDDLIGSTAMASGIEPYTVLNIGDSNYITDHDPNESPYWNYKVCGHELFYSKGALARWVRDVLRWHQLEFRRVQSLPNFPRQAFENYIALVPREIAR